MKESTGGALLMGLAAMIIMVFIIMVAFFISYGKAFKIKNDLVNYIEQNEGINLDELKNVTLERYNGREVSICYNKLSNGAFTVKLAVYVKTDEDYFPLLANIKIPIEGETRLIEKGAFYKGDKSFGLIKACPKNTNLSISQRLKEYTTIND